MHPIKSSALLQITNSPTPAPSSRLRASGLRVVWLVVFLVSGSGIGYLYWYWYWFLVVRLLLCSTPFNSGSGTGGVPGLGKRKLCPKIPAISGHSQVWLSVLNYSALPNSIAQRFLFVLNSNSIAQRFSSFLNSNSTALWFLFISRLKPQDPSTVLGLPPIQPFVLRV